MKGIINLSALLIVALLAQAMCHAQHRRCKQETFGSTIQGGQDFTHRIDSNLELRMGAASDNSGWEISVKARGSDQDWTLPVNLPVSGESQLIGTGYGMTVSEKLSRPRELRFTLNQAEFDRFWRMAYEPHGAPDTAASPDEFIKEIREAQTGRILFMPLKFQNRGSSKTVKWLRFTIKVTVPEYFQTDDAGWRIVQCPIGPLLGQ
jgi:hypothetical protein